MKTQAGVLVLVLAGALATAAPAAEPPGRGYKAVRTFTADKGTPNPFRRSDVLAVDFLTTGFAQPDGSDICVFASKDGRPADFKIMMMGPGDRARIAIRMITGETQYRIAYGGPPAQRSRWEPDVGLVLETRKFSGGDPASLAAMHKLIEASGPSFGCDLVPNVFLGFNPFGPSQNYVSIYNGWLNIPKAGTYRFATTSDDASFLLVDGKFASSKLGWSGAPGDARFAGPAVQLSEGIHHFEYLHVQGGGGTACVAAWQPPGGTFHVIPPAAFPGVFTAKQVGLEVAGSPVPLDLACSTSGEVLYENLHLFKMRFRDVTAGDLSKPFAPLWSFGDGTSSTDRDPEHVYFLPGEYTVTFTLSRGSSAVTLRQRIIVGAESDLLRQTVADTAEDYYQIVKKYDFAAMKSAHLEAALAFLFALGRDQEIMKASAAMLGRDDEIARRNRYACAVALGERLRDLQGKPDEALAVFRAAIQRESDDANKARLIRRCGDTLLYSLRKPDDALAEYRRVLDTYGKLQDNIVRLAQIRIGDAYKAKADHARALDAYRAAERMIDYDRTHAVSSVRRGSFAQSIEDFLARKEFAEAQNLLDTWGWENPADRLDGAWSLTAAKVALARGDKAGAVREATQCADANPLGPLADQLLLLAGTTSLAQNRGADALLLARRIQKDYPESALQMDAALLECQALCRTKEYAEAAKKSAEGYARYSGDEDAPRFLLIAADAALGLGDRARAVELLRLVIKDHARSPQAAEASTRLKALGQNTDK